MQELDRFIVQPGKKPGTWAVTDTKYRIVLVFEHGKYNETQKVAALEDFDPSRQMELAGAMQEMGNFMVKNHYEKIF